MQLKSWSVIIFEIYFLISLHCKLLISNGNNLPNNNLPISIQLSWEKILLGKKKQGGNEIGSYIVTKNCCVGNFWRVSQKRSLGGKFQRDIMHDECQIDKGFLSWQERFIFYVGVLNVRGARQFFKKWVVQGLLFWVFEFSASMAEEIACFEITNYWFNIVIGCVSARLRDSWVVRIHLLNKKKAITQQTCRT